MASNFVTFMNKKRLLRNLSTLQKSQRSQAFAGLCSQTVGIPCSHMSVTSETFSETSMTSNSLGKYTEWTRQNPHPAENTDDKRTAMNMS